MGTPAERAVIAAARRLIAHTDDIGRAEAPLVEHPADGTRAEAPFTWGQLVADDELWSEKAGKWFTVLETKHEDTPGNDVGKTHVRLKGVGTSFANPSNVMARVRRSAMGEAVDVFAAVIWSGPNGKADA